MKSKTYAAAMTATFVASAIAMDFYLAFAKNRESKKLMNSAMQRVANRVASGEIKTIEQLKEDIEFEIIAINNR